MNTIATANRYRSIWISDIHLGTRGCKAELLLDFLSHTESEYLYLVGDIIDCWRLRRAWYWAQSHNDVVQKVLRKARKGTRVIYVPGNHDEPLRDYTDMQFGGVTVLEEAIHETADGRRLLILHGDAFDGIVKYANWLAILGDHAYNAPDRRQPLVQPRRAASSAIPTGRSRPTSSTRSRTPSAISTISRSRWPRRRASAASTAWSAAISTRPRCARSAASSTATTATGWRAAPPWSSTGRPARDPRLGQPAQLLDAEPGLAAECASSSSPTPGCRRSTAWSAP